MINSRKMVVLIFNYSTGKNYTLVQMSNQFNLFTHLLNIFLRVEQGSVIAASPPVFGEKTSVPAIFAGWSWQDFSTDFPEF